MQIDFCDPDDFVAEVSSLKDEIDNSIVRLQIEKAKVNQVLTAYAVRAGFIFSADLYQFRQECGVSPPTPGEPSGEEVAQRICALIQEGCRAAKMEVRKGMFVG